MASADIKKLIACIETVAVNHGNKIAVHDDNIERLNKDMSDTVKAVNELGKSTERIAGSLEVQSRISYAILGVTLIAFLGLVIQSYSVDRGGFTSSQAYYGPFHERLVTPSEKDNGNR